MLPSQQHCRSGHHRSHGWCSWTKWAALLAVLLAAAAFIFALLVFLKLKHVHAPTGATGATGATGTGPRGATGATGAPGSVSDDTLVMMNVLGNIAGSDSIFPPSGPVIAFQPALNTSIGFIKMAIPKNCVARDYRAWVSPAIPPATDATCGPSGTLPCNGTVTWALEANALGNDVLTCTITPGHSECTDPDGVVCLTTNDFIWERATAGENVPSPLFGGASFVCTEPC